jgi:hypothetical protein
MGHGTTIERAFAARFLLAVAASSAPARSDPRRTAGFKEPGFAHAWLVASLYGLPRLPRRLVSDRPRLLARWSVDRDGRIAEE